MTQDSPSSSLPPWYTRGELWPLLAVLGLIAAASLLCYRTEPFSQAEFLEVAMGRRGQLGWDWIRQVLGTELHGPFYPLIALVLDRLAVDGEVPHRLFSLGFLLFGVGAWYRFCRESMDARAAMVAALFVGLNGAAIAASQDFLRYSLHLALGLLCVGWLFRSLRSERRRPSLWLGVLVFLAILNHLIIGLTLLAFVPVWLVAYRTARNRWWPPIAAVAGALLTLPFTFHLLVGAEEDPGMPPVDAALLGQLWEMFEGDMLLPILGVAMLIRWGYQRLPPWRQLVFTRGWPGLALWHVLLVVVPIAALLLLGGFVVRVTYPDYLLPVLGSLGALYGAAYAGGGKVLRAVLLAALLLHAVDTVQARCENHRKTRSSFFAQTTAAIDSIEDRTTQVRVLPEWDRAGVRHYFRRLGRNDLEIFNGYSDQPPFPERVCLVGGDVVGPPGAHAYERWRVTRRVLRERYRVERELDRAEDVWLVCYEGLLHPEAQAPGGGR